MARKLLVIDDEASVTSVIERVARSLGLDVKVVREPLQATEIFIDFRPDIVMLDMVMPEKDGIEILEEIMLSGIPTTLILLAGLSDAYLRLAQGVARFHGASALTVLHKPFRRHELAILLRDMLPC